VLIPVRAVAPPPDPAEKKNGDNGAPRTEEPRGVASNFLEGLDVLVVDDEPDARDLVTAVLVKCGARVRTASTVENALERVREQRPDVLISDIGLPSEDGFSLIRRVREIEPEVPAAALTAYASPGDQQRVLSGGFDAHVSKPVEPADLALLVASLARRMVSIRAVPELSDGQPAAAEGGPA